MCECKNKCNVENCCENKWIKIKIEKLNGIEVEIQFLNFLDETSEIEYLLNIPDETLKEYSENEIKKYLNEIILESIKKSIEQLKL